ncbi:hypothetical protein MTO96_016831 [Rhipicephalus appendiculatus]
MHEEGQASSSETGGQASSSETGGQTSSSVTGPAEAAAAMPRPTSTVLLGSHHRGGGSSADTGDPVHLRAVHHHAKPSATGIPGANALPAWVSRFPASSSGIQRTMTIVRA